MIDRHAHELSLLALRPPRLPAQQPAHQQHRNDRAAELGGDETGQIGRTNSRKRIGQRSRDGDRRIGKRRRRREPIGCRDVKPDQPGHRRPIEPDAGENGDNQAERRHAFGQPLRAAGSDLQRGIQQRQAEHRMRHDGSGDAAGDLRRHIRAAPRAASARAWSANTSDTAGLKCAPDIGPRIVMSTTRIAPVGSVLPSNASATSLVSVSAMMPEPTTVATNIAVPRASAIRRRGRSNFCISALFSDRRTTRGQVFDQRRADFRDCCDGHRKSARR